MTCIAWDRGAIRDSIRDVLGFALEPKTTLTKCGRRRRISEIDNQAATCPACREQVEREDRESYELLGELEAIKARKDPS